VLLLRSPLAHGGAQVPEAPVLFAHIVKASEPVVTCVLNRLIQKEVLPLKVYLTLLPIIGGGDGHREHGGINFHLFGAGSAMLSNLSSSARVVLSKKTMSGKQIEENMDAQNLYAVLTAMSALILVSLCLAVEGTGFLQGFADAIATGDFTKKSLSILLTLSGFTYYAYIEVTFLALGKVNPVTHAVGNTIKRVVIIVASVIAFKTPMSTGSIIETSIVIFGILLYSLAMNFIKK